MIDQETALAGHQLGRHGQIGGEEEVVANQEAMTRLLQPAQGADQSPSDCEQIQAFLAGTGRATSPCHETLSSKQREE